MPDYATRMRTLGHRGQCEELGTLNNLLAHTTMQPERAQLCAQRDVLVSLGAHPLYDERSMPLRGMCCA